MGAPRRRRGWARAGRWPSILAALGVAVPAAAQGGGETLHTTRGAALGTGVRASAASSSALAYNAAALPAGQLYHIETLASHHTRDGRWSLGGAVVDSVTNRLAAGLSVRGIFGDGAESYSGIDGRLGIGLPVSGPISIGVEGRYVRLTRETVDGSGETVTERLVGGFSLDAAIKLELTGGIHLAALGYNMIAYDSPLAPTIFGGSAAYQLGESISLGADLLFDTTTYDRAEMIVGGGVEYLAAGQVPLRAGYAFDAGAGEHTVSGGIGYVDQRVGVDLALRQVVEGEKQTEVFAALRYFVH